MSEKVSNPSEMSESKVALLLIDVISDFEFEDGEKLYEFALPVVRNIAALKKDAKKLKIPVIYINDNFGKWQENFDQIVEYCLSEDVRGKEIVEILKPEDDDLYILKPKHSAFYSTALEILLHNMKAETLILTGFSTDICVLFTAADAFMRDYSVIVPKDCVAAVSEAENKHALEYIERVLEAETRASTELKLTEII